jgi:hypothetical protein
MTPSHTLVSMIALLCATNAGKVVKEAGIKVE